MGKKSVNVILNKSFFVTCETPISTALSEDISISAFSIDHRLFSLAIYKPTFLFGAFMVLFGFLLPLVPLLVQLVLHA